MPIHSLWFQEKPLLVHSKNLWQNQLHLTHLISKQFFINEFFQMKKKSEVSSFKLQIDSSSCKKFQISYLLFSDIELSFILPITSSSQEVIEVSHKFCSLVTLSNLSPNLSILTLSITLHKKKSLCQPEVLNS